MCYFKRNKRITKSLLAGPTIPFLFNALFLFLDFLVRMWRLKDFWKVISPVPVTLKRFFALELVLTFGINNLFFRLYPAGGTHRDALVEPYGKKFWSANVSIFTNKPTFHPKNLISMVFLH